MKVNRGLLLVAALAAGSAGLIGCNTAASATDEATTDVAASTSADQGVEKDCNDGAGVNAGTAEFARWGRGFGRGGRGGRGEGRGRGWGWGRGFRHDRDGHRRWWRFW